MEQERKEKREILDQMSYLKAKCDTMHEFEDRAV